MGHLKPGSTASVIVKYVCELPAEEKAVRLTIPTTIAPRYKPQSDKSKVAKKLSAIKYTVDSPAPLTIAVTTIAKNKINAIKCPSHTIKTESATVTQDGQHVVKCSLNGSITDMDRDFVLLVKSGKIHDPVVFVEKSQV